MAQKCCANSIKKIGAFPSVKLGHEKTPLKIPKCHIRLKHRLSFRRSVAQGINHCVVGNGVGPNATGRGTPGMFRNTRDFCVKMLNTLRHQVPWLARKSQQRHGRWKINNTNL